MIKILFVCHGNICRSPMAEFVMKDIVKKAGKEADFKISSCATSAEELGNDIHPGAKNELTKNSVSYDTRRARQLIKKDYDVYQLLVAMDNNNLQNIMRIIKSDPLNKVHLLLEFTGENRSITDPWYTGDFEDTYKDILNGCNALFESQITIIA